MRISQEIYKHNWERYIEANILINILFRVKRKINVFDVGFSGGYYLLDLLNLENVNTVTGIDNDISRIKGDSFDTPKELKEIWYNQVLPYIEYKEIDILNTDIEDRFDFGISISTIEHITPLGYANNQEYDDYNDIKAVGKMKDLLLEDGLLYLTFPCGVEEKYFSKKNKYKEELLNHGYKLGHHDIIYYNEDRISKVIGDWKIVREHYWTNPKVEEIEKQEAMKIVNGENPKGLCTLLLRK